MPFLVDMLVPRRVSLRIIQLRPESELRSSYILVMYFSSQWWFQGVSLFTWRFLIVHCKIMISLFVEEWSSWRETHGSVMLCFSAKNSATWTSPRNEMVTLTYQTSILDHFWGNLFYQVAVDFQLPETNKQFIPENPILKDMAYVQGRAISFRWGRSRFFWSLAGF